MGVDSNAIMPQKNYYLWYKGFYMKYITNINPRTHSLDTKNTDSILTIAHRESERNVWRAMAEFMRAWAYANDLQINVIPGMTNNCEPQLKQIKEFCNQYGDLRRIPLYMGFIKGTEFVRVAQIDTEEKSELLRLYTTAEANSNVYFQILFFWHTIVYPSGNDDNAVQYVNNHLTNVDNIECYKKRILDGTFGTVQNNDIGAYIKSKVRHAIAHIVRNNHINIVIDDIKQGNHLHAIKEVLKGVARYKLNTDYSFSENAPSSICRYFDPDIEFTSNSITYK
jgi:hypothetical protein